MCWTTKKDIFFAFRVKNFSYETSLVRSCVFRPINIYMLYFFVWFWSNFFLGGWKVTLQTIRYFPRCRGSATCCPTHIPRTAHWEAVDSRHRQYCQITENWHLLPFGYYYSVSAVNRNRLIQQRRARTHCFYVTHQYAQGKRHVRATGPSCQYAQPRLRSGCCLQEQVGYRTPLVHLTYSLCAFSNQTTRRDNCRYLSLQYCARTSTWRR